MCGICGFVGESDPDVLARMRDALVHRGPDGAGAFNDRDVSLAHRRLAIIDLDEGRQPMFNEDGSVAVVFNGEIYNHVELRTQLQRLGHRFKTRSDTECIVHAYEEFGTECTRHLDGMFSFVLYDTSKRILFGARDRFGKKPLYYVALPRLESPVRFAFASELKSLWQHPVLLHHRRLSQDGLISYLVNDYIVAPQTAFEGVRQLEPGCSFVYRINKTSDECLQIRRFWKPTFGCDSRLNPPPSEDEAQDQIIKLLSAAVERRLMADVPLGVFLSGGIDSSAIVGLLRRMRPSDRISTFSIGFDEPSFDESSYATRIAQRFGTDHHCRRFTVRDMVDRVPAVIETMDEPFADPSILPVSMLCQFARETVTVTLGGDGGDELFAGYDPVRALFAGRVYYRLIPEWMHRGVMLPISHCLPASSTNMSLGFRVNRFLRGAAAPAGCRLPTWMGPFSTDQLRSLLPDAGEDLTPAKAYAPALAAAAVMEQAGTDEIEHATDFFMRFYLANDILVKVDRASMMHSLEVRAPFLDTALVEYVNALPSHMKFRRGTSKYILKQALTRGGEQSPILPNETVHRAKKGFGIPVARWIRTDLKGEFRTRLGDDWPEALGMFHRPYINELLERHISGRENNYKELWALYVLALWAENNQLR